MAWLPGNRTEGESQTASSFAGQREPGCSVQLSPKVFSPVVFFVCFQRPDSGEAKLASFQDTVEATLMFVESYLMMHRRNDVCFVACTARER